MDQPHTIKCITAIRYPMMRISWTKFVSALLLYVCLAPSLHVQRIESAAPTCSLIVTRHAILFPVSRRHTVNTIRTPPQQYSVNLLYYYYSVPVLLNNYGLRQNSLYFIPTPLQYYAFRTLSLRTPVLLPFAPLFIRSQISFLPSLKKTGGELNRARATPCLLLSCADQRVIYCWHD